jgi:hypothetical protein
MLMPAYYSVVQYVPDPVTDERINVGVIVFGDGHVASRFVDNWQRVRTFGGENIGFLRKFANEADQMTEAEIRKIAREWYHSVRLTEPAGSLLGRDDLLNDISSRYLRDWSPAQRTYRTRRQAVVLATNAVTVAVERACGEQAKGLIRNDYRLRGRTGKHPFDVTAVNGEPYFAARALSFEGSTESTSLLHAIESTNYALEDVRDNGLPLAVVTLPPRHLVLDTYQEAVESFRDKGADVVEEGDIKDWAGTMAKLVRDRRVGQSPG